MVISKKYIDNFLVLVPFLLVYIGTVFQTTNAELCSFLKMTGFVYMFVYIFFTDKLNANLVRGFLVFLPFLVYGIFNTFKIKAGISDGIRYLFPIVTLFYSFSIKKYFPLLLNFIVFFVVINFGVQIVNYLNWIRGVDQWFYYETADGYRYYNETAGVIRATGTVIFFGFFGFFNLISFFVIKEFYNGKFKKLLLILCLLSLFLSVSYKTLVTLFIIIGLIYYKHLIKMIPIAIAALLVLAVNFPAIAESVVKDIVLRFNVYISEGTSMRAESYRVMFEEIVNFNLFGRGVGMFGGPASVMYNSPYYQEVYFYWYDTGWLDLPTTDTYPPHAFVELGIIGGSLYFLFLALPLLRNKFDNKLKIVLMIYFALFVDMLFSFSLNNLEFLLYSLALVYPILYFNNEKAICLEK